MSDHEPIPSPAAVPVRRTGLRAVFFLLITALAVAVAGGAFFGGVMLERKESAALAVRLEAVELERDELSAKVRELRQQSIVLERSQQIDREANRNALEQLKEAQDERLGLEKEVSLLRRLVSEGGAGILQVKDVVITAADEPELFRYSFMVTQVIQDFGEVSGRVRLKISGKRDGTEVTLSLSKLEGSDPMRQEMKLKHFQNFEGSLQLPEDFEPESLVVDIEPTTERLLPVSQTFPWGVAD